MFQQIGIRTRSLVGLLAVLLSSSLYADPTACGDRFLNEAQIATLVPGMTRDEVVQLIGQPGCYRGHGLIYETYPLSNGRLLWLLYSIDGDPRLIVAFIRIQGGVRQPLNPFLD
ncbi:MAG: hypothetical protein AAAFM81_08625 [Pseudomonadota bacterium]